VWDYDLEILQCRNIASNVDFNTLQKALKEIMILKYCNPKTLHPMLTSTHCKKKIMQYWPLHTKKQKPNLRAMFTISNEFAKKEKWKLDDKNSARVLNPLQFLNLNGKECKSRIKILISDPCHLASVLSTLA
jgi:hypothetical protein